MKKGFTLIELLAVIVILAIIALIATPIILNIIEDSKEQSVISSANLYVDGLVKHIAKMNLENEFNPSSCTIANGVASCDETSLNYEINGQAPTSGTISFNNGIVTGYTLAISGYTVTKSGNAVTLTKGEPTVYTAYTMGQLLQYDPVNNTACTTGDTCYKWRVITVGDTTSNSNITLQMDHNIVNKSAWASQEDYNDEANYGEHGNNNKGPITALKALETATSTWDNSLKLNYSYDTSLGGTNTGHNYGTLTCTNGACTVAGNQITSNLKARMITGEEVRLLTLAAGAEEGTNAYNWTVASNLQYYFSNTDYVIGTRVLIVSGETGSTELSWLIENTEVNEYDEYNIGYWTLSSRTSEFASSAWYVTWGGCLGSDDDDGVGYDYDYGVRPVITLPKSIFE